MDTVGVESEAPGTGGLSREIFHVHTWRCQHASPESEEAYIVMAIQMGAQRITFTDHCPFPGDPFIGRMRMDELDQYLFMLGQLRVRFREIIDVRIGLEAEYLPDYTDYLRSLTDQLDLLICGQHFCALQGGGYGFDLQEMAEAQVQAIRSGLFSVLAHPDRMFSRAGEWSPLLQELSLEMISAAREYGVALERNLSSMRHPGQYREEFWALVPDDVSVITGCDAHSCADLDLYRRFGFW